MNRPVMKDTLSPQGYFALALKFGTEHVKLGKENKASVKKMAYKLTKSGG